VQGVALGEGGGTTDWNPGLGDAESSFHALLAAGTIQRITGRYGAMDVADVAEAHLFIVTRPRGQKLDVIRVRAY
jgi:hypothetical protein